MMDTNEYQFKQLLEVRSALAGATGILMSLRDMQDAEGMRVYLAKQVDELEAVLAQPIFPPRQATDGSNVIPMTPPGHVKGEPA